MAAKSIISRPVYGTLSPQPGKHHLFIADAEGALAILGMAGKAPPGFFDGAEIVFIPGPDGKHVAYFFEAGGASWIGVIDIDKGDVVNRFPIPKGNELLWISWAGDHRLLLSLLVSEKNAWSACTFSSASFT